MEFEPDNRAGNSFRQSLAFICKSSKSLVSFLLINSTKKERKAVFGLSVGCVLETGPGSQRTNHSTERYDWRLKKNPLFLGNLCGLKPDGLGLRNAGDVEQNEYNLVYIRPECKNLDEQTRKWPQSRGYGPIWRVMMQAPEIVSAVIVRLIAC
ncbi:unnamed protein product [Kuraishia capsulata CBS 1993]|uniref:Uncharacterized protein n=1 Tax=Kuraishia capsulata CBS 1993 TaxID=1382522 RepID=W6MG86_9ASCO|nr:uncharacterized protein KUCA_T00000742001 [Kuraishia capsulata CBS 1993]CDK24776.1 unnamed protein product [Kuraishia capsulata CBS 1993]